MWHLKNKINDRTKQNQTHGEQTDGHQMGGGGRGLRATWQAANRHGDVRFGTGGRVGDPGTRRGEPWPGQTARSFHECLPTRPQPWTRFNLRCQLHLKRKFNFREKGGLGRRWTVPSGVGGQLG